MPDETEDDVFNKAEMRYEARLVPRSLPRRVAAWVGNTAVILTLQSPEAPFPAQDGIIVVDLQTNRVVIRRRDTVDPASALMGELSDDLKNLSIRQFRPGVPTSPFRSGVEWGIPKRRLRALRRRSHQGAIEACSRLWRMRRRERVRRRPEAPAIRRRRHGPSAPRRRAIELSG
jgi:hypothetical protein